VFQPATDQPIKSPKKASKDRDLRPTKVFLALPRLLGFGQTLTETLKVADQRGAFKATMVKIIEEQYRLERQFSFKGDMLCYDRFDDVIARGEVMGAAALDPWGKMISSDRSRQ
jgi:hypothetical protein